MEAQSSVQILLDNAVSENSVMSEAVMSDTSVVDRCDVDSEEVNYSGMSESVVCHELFSTEVDFSDSDDVFRAISFYDKEKYVDSSLSGVISKVPLLSCLLYPSVYVDSYLSHVDSEVVMCQSVSISGGKSVEEFECEEYKFFPCGLMHVLREEESLRTCSSVSFSPLDEKKIPRKRPRLIYVKPGGARSSCSESCKKGAEESSVSHCMSCDSTCVRDEVILLQSKVDGVLNNIQQCVAEAEANVSVSNAVGAFEKLECLRNIVLRSKADIHQSFAKVRRSVSQKKLFSA